MKMKNQIDLISFGVNILYQADFVSAKVDSIKKSKQFLGNKEGRD